MKYLFVKMRRDLFKMWTQFFSVFMMAFLGLLIYVGTEGTWYGMQTEINNYFSKTNLASAWIYGNGITNSDLKKIKSLNGVTNGTLAMTLSAKVKLSGLSDGKEPDLSLTSYASNKISAPFTISGVSYFPSGSGIWLDNDFATANDIKVGDIITISVGDVQETLRVNGLVISSEYMYYTGSGTNAMPNHKQHGFAFIGSDTAEDIMNETITLNMQKAFVPQLEDKINGAYKTAQDTADASVEQSFKNTIDEKQLESAKNIAETSAKDEATKEILKEYNLTEDQFNAINTLISLPKISSLDSIGKVDTSRQFIILLKKLPDSMLSQSVGGFSISILKETPVDYNIIRITTNSDASTKTIEQKAQDILGNRYAGFDDRDTLASVLTPVQKTQQIEKMSIMFSIIFVLLALLTMQTTMTRLVDTQRTQIGTMKALGFKNSQIKLHYMVYGLTVGLLGGLLGLIIAPFTISPALLHSQIGLYTLPDWPVRITPVSFAMVIIVALCCILATLFACQKGLVGMPAETMRGAVPRAGRQVLLEKIPRLWQKISFGWKWTIRDISRSKVRSVMGMIGVLGCMMLLIASFGMQSTDDSVPGFIYGVQYTYQSKAVLFSSATQDNQDELYKTAGGGQWIQESSIEYKNSPTGETGTISVLGDGNYVHLENGEGITVKLPKQGIIVTQRTAKILGLKKGSQVEFRVAGERSYIVATVTDIVLTPAPQGIFISQSAWKNLRESFNPTSLLIGNTNNKLSDLSYVQEVTTLKSQYESTVDSLIPFDFIFQLLKIAAILLDVVILYNLGILSFTERTREYATLKVLGFHQKEIRSFALRENLATTIAGWLIGIPVGLWFLKLYVGAVSSSSLDMTPKMTLQDFMLATIITVGCSVCVNLFLSHKVRRIDMVGALKSIE